ncbi:GNAT family N-acetyltransferase [Jeotgalibacillus sp. ET6]|uniref:GNAT family N-acetyltransferase n=1 Tax=Jeotgalibacillus sp. ET6 TaxID=3037260 RepID=UPI0024188A02|nr:GNAT family N-acetyltransferase [Jeotgalibacillus sp. ET6]MDG5471900.1 GNAT family N-acetyltransferase [Jeotgalibacillus sp. ET6]
MFETRRCRLIEVRIPDAEEIKALYSNQEVRKYLGGVREADSVQEEINKMVLLRKPIFCWVVREKRTDRFMGTLSLDPHHDGHDFELSYQFLPEWWGKGFAKETVLFAINYAFTELKLKKIVAETQTANVSSCKLLEKSGMKLEKIVTRFGAEQALYSIEAG